MQIREINKDELNSYLKNIDHSLYQTSEYAKTMEKQLFSIKLLGLEENGNIIGSTILLIVKKHVHGKLRKPLIIFLSCMMFLIPISRIYFGVHYLTDVLASIILGIIILIITNMIMDKEYYIHDKNKDKKTI